ncbi:hypothetical protein LCGC14_2705470, partial [marine sediment metagenome]
LRSSEHVDILVQALERPDIEHGESSPIYLFSSNLIFIVFPVLEIQNENLFMFI